MKTDKLANQQAPTTDRRLPANDDRPPTTDRRLPATKKGFTILELLVVIFIMMAMTGIAVAAFGKFLDTERIKLAGGQVAGAIRMARQYAMSKRCKVMVEFMEPPYGAGLCEGVVDTSGTVRARYGEPDIVESTSCGAKWAGSTTNSYHRRGYAKFDLSGLPASVQSINSALLVCDVNTWNTTDSIAVTVKSVGDDSWDPATLTWNTMPAPGGALASFTATKSEEKKVDVTAYVSGQFGGDKTVSLQFYAGSGSNGLTFNNLRLELLYTYDTGVEQTEVAHLPRSVRIIPYIRDYNMTTGGFAWLLDQDINHLKELELPRNIHYVLAPGVLVVDQYDPGDLGDRRSSARKIFFNLWPDGSCTAEAPDVDGWSNRVNTVILHDAVTNDLALLFVPPSSAFTRQRFLFGDEVDAFVAAHSLYSLW